mmetsp:Transcript_12835/g.10967  ORF Transcript_12835/g.10967 Transcript_12835/m.10967 type:complete len:153 (-) Transcript_12835:118-576(-)|eukprot:CAMPEP_0114580128 /NCGR_PEP_ID=MMETSP0125-20121206/4465_1 /TAXON_ID=485358 ORGANISM="Aristerostoma sp., Strain ATCC 50986" /NCGR_SAMPLE_ID=MMETSP0125 /ASSEMBLY_ACC=CAM_ASM_000245 /LENGTH=152 /DNA_ID=CAMNT_0001771483 /DNA_START=768 /DNA_END=1226 /DNA_ORIENTATION=-
MELLRNNKQITNEQGFVDVHQGTLQSTKYPNVWSLGDCASCPTSKTAAAVMSETPVLIHNMKQVMKGEANPQFAQYNGYTSCPLFIGKKKVILAEFKYGGEVDETFPFMQKGPHTMFHYFKTHLFPFAYFKLVPKGLWYGRNGFLKPGHVYI